MCEDNIEIGVTEITNNILVSATPTDQIIDINVLETTENVELTITPSVVEVNIDVTQELITEVVTIDANTCVNIIDVSVTDATENVVLNITPSLVEVNINRGENNLSIEEYATFADFPTIGNTDTYYITLDDNKFWRWDSVDEVYLEISDSNDRIPYLGAIKNSDLGEWGIKSGWYGLDLTPTNTPTVAGTLSWNDSDGTADLKLKGGNVTLQLGQEQVVRVVNKTGATLNEADFRVVRVRNVSEGGAQGQRLAVLLAKGDSDTDSATTIGLVTETILDNQEGFITTFGNVSEINTTGAKSWGGTETWVDGDMLYVSPTHAGYLTNIKPVAPQHMVVVGYVVYAHANHGKIFVKVDNGYELDELHNVLISSATNKDTLVYNSTSGIWENKPLSYLLSATAPLSLTSGVLSISQANATTDGYVTSADWNYFSAKQSALSGTGFVKITGSTISYDNTTYTPTSRTLTINGTAYDLSADRSWSISVGSGMRNVSSFIATAGQTTFTIVGGYTVGLVDVFVNGARLNASDYTATNGTTVVLGTGLVANDIVDIINYVASLTSGITGSGTANYVPKWSASSNLTNSLIYSGTSGIGIGTTSPTALLDVRGIGYLEQGLQLGSGYQLMFADTGTTVYSAIEGSSYNASYSFLRFLTYGTEKMRLTSTGYLGIGTSTPRASIETLGYIYSGGNWIPNDTSGAAFYIGDLATGASYTYISGKGTSTTDTYLAFSTNNLERARIIANGNFGIGLINPAYKIDVVGDVNITGAFRINGVAIGGGSGTVTGGGTIGYLAKWSGTTAINGSLIYDNGSHIGIGTTTPDTYTQFGTGGGFTLQTAVTNGSSNINVVGNGTGFGGINFGNGTIRRAGIYGLDGSSLGFYTNATNSGTSLTERMRIAANGRVGINNSSPNYAMHITGTSGVGERLLQVDGTGTAFNLMSVVNNGCQLFLATEGNTGGNIATGSIAYAGVIDTNTNTSLQFATWATVRMTILNSGNVGIGTTTPSSILELSQPQYTFITLTGTNSTQVQMNLGVNQVTQGAYISSVTNHPLILQTNSAERMRITSGGTICINETSAGTEKLNVKQTGVNWGTVFNHTYSTQYHIEFRYNGSGVGNIVGNGSSISFNSTSDYRLKEDLKPINGLEKLLKINVYDFKWKNFDNRMDGVLAHELQEVLPYAVTGIKDGKDMQSVDYSKIVPVLVQAIKELNAKLEAK